ncbi:MAG: hypothetical protein K2W96_25305 [Gemmataceae bacterium]|nr:hypothetical protein [Gemmataceae bacterium]
MGFESFQAVLRGEPQPIEEIVSIIGSIPGLRDDPNPGWHRGSRYLLAEDERHLIEMEIDADRVSCRFALCHPATVDDAFTGLLLELATRLGWRIDLLDDSSGRPFGPEEGAEMETAAKRSIAQRRAEWVSAFGPQTRRCTTAEAWAPFIIPRSKEDQASGAA